MAKTASRSTPRVTALAIGLLALLVVGPAVVSGQDKKNGLFHPWAATAEVSYVVTGGNTSTSALSLGTSFSRKWTNDTLLFRSYILTSNATTTTRTAQGTEDGFHHHREQGHAPGRRELSPGRPVRPPRLQEAQRPGRPELGPQPLRRRRRPGHRHDRLRLRLGRQAPDPGQDLGRPDLHDAAVRRTERRVLRRVPLDRLRRPEDPRQLVRLDPVPFRRQPEPGAPTGDSIGPTR